MITAICAQAQTKSVEISKDIKESPLTDLTMEEAVMGQFRQFYPKHLLPMMPRQYVHEGTWPIYVYVIASVTTENYRQ